MKALSSSFFLMVICFPLFPLERTGIIDYDMTTGEKPIPPLYDNNGKLGHALDHSSVLNQFSALEPEEQKSNGKLMVLKFKENDEIKHEFIDFDLNGVFEGWKEYESGMVAVENRLDEEKHIIYEKTIFDKRGNIVMVLQDESHRGFLSEKSIYSNGRITRTEKDSDGDGLYEEEIVYFEDDITRPIEQKIAAGTVRNGKKLYVAGLYNHGEIISIDKDLTRQIISHLGGKVVNRIEDVDGYQKIIFKEEEKSAALERRYPNRFEIYRAIAISEKTESSDLPHSYICSGDIYRDSGRVRVYYRLLGPTPVDQVIAGSVQMAATEYSNATAARKISKKILKSLR